MSSVTSQPRFLAISAVPVSRWLRDGWLLLAALGLVYAPTLWHLAKTWWTDPDYSFGLFIPFIVLFFLWRMRDDLRRRPAEPTRFGLLVIAASQIIYLVGYLGAEFFLQGFSFIALLAGLILATRGWATFRKASFLLLLLLLSIPLPAIILNAVTFPLQLLASSWAESILHFLGIPVLRDGNILILDKITLNIADACSGLRSLASLVTAGVVVAYFLPSRWWVRVIFVLTTVPIALAANACRVAGTGMLAEFVGQQWAEGFLHLFSGWLVFVAAFCFLCGEWALIQRLSRRRRQTAGVDSLETVGSLPKLEVTTVPAPGVFTLMNHRLLIPSAILLLSFGLRVWLGASPVAPAREQLTDFPSQLGSWRMLRDDKIDPETLAVLKADDYLQRGYQNSEGQYASIFVAYYRSQQAGESMHSPKNCLPGSGWEPVESDRLLIGTDSAGRPIQVNRYVVENSEGKRELVLYWYQEQGRVIASEYWAKLYMIWDTIRSGRRDGAIVRVTVPMLGKEDSSALNAALDLVRTIIPILPRFVPN
ncbi:MAG: VPLPA-CTERM-specific exosortase XrtD [Terriglobia bacterium]